MMERIGPYRVEEQIGVGGMGEVYKAFDDRLDRWVAIKRIRNDKEQAGENRERFQREARATARLSHASIVHLYDIFRDGENDCIVMEFVEGLTLDKLIKNGPLEAVQAATLGHEVANGLAEAHSKGIIHRDLKVENVIVTPEGHAKILDFGLARPLLSNELDPSLTGKGQLVGTSRAMSPEYVGGESIDHRSDLFSLGVLLYEAVTSHSPFKAHNTLATLKQVMLHRQTPAHVVNANVPEDLSDLIERLLAKDPEDRPQDAKEVAHELGQISGNLSSGGVSRPTLNVAFSTTPTEVLPSSVTTAEAWPRRRWMVVAALLVTGVVGTFAVTRWLSEPPQNIPTPDGIEVREVKQKDRIVLADFQNLTGEPLLDDSIELLFRLGLEQSRHAYVLPRAEIQNALLRMKREASTPIDREVGMEIGQREGARALVIGSIGKIGDTYSVSAEVVDPQTGVNALSIRENASDQDSIVTALESATKAIRLSLGESVAAFEENQQRLEKVTTNDLEALKAYSLGAERIDEEQDEAAIQLLLRAIEIDPDFAMAYAKLATAYINLGYEDAQILDVLDQALKSSDRLTAFEKLYVEGWAARLEGDPETVVNTWSLMSTLFPEAFPGHFNFGMSARIYNIDYETAAKAFEKAARTATPENLERSLWRLGYCQIALGRYDDASRNFDRLTGEVRQVSLSDLYLATRNYAELKPLLEQVAVTARRSVQVRLRWAQYYADVGDFPNALREARLAGEIAASDGEVEMSSLLVSGLAVAAIMEQLRPRRASQEGLLAVIETAKELMGKDRQGPADSSPIRELTLVGKLAARSGYVESASAIDRWVRPLVQETPIAAWQSYSLMLQGEILAAEGGVEAAIIRFEEALNIVESFQIHESLAYGLETAGLLETAIGEYEWLTRHRGWGFVECLDQCAAVNLIDWATAFHRLGILHERIGDSKAAVAFYRRLLEHWSLAGESTTRADVERRLAALLAATNT